MRDLLTQLPRPWKQALLFSFDLCALWLSIALAYLGRLGGFDAFADKFDSFALVFALVPLTTVPYFIRSGLYSAVTRHAGLEMIGTIVRAVTLGMVTFLLIDFLLPHKPLIPRSMPVSSWASSILIMTGGRYWAGIWLHGHSIKTILLQLVGFRRRRRNSHSAPVAIYGAGDAGRQLIAALGKSRSYDPVAFIDDSPELQNTVIAGLRVYPPSEVKKMMDATGARELLLAIPSASRSRRRHIIEMFEPYQLHIRTMPSFEELAQGRVKVEGIRDVEVADILGRDPIPPIPELFAPCIQGKSVLVTGAGGSIGAELCRQIITAAPARIVLLENSEYSLYQIAEELERLSAQSTAPVEVIPVLDSVTQPWRLLAVMKRFHIHTLYHAAAYKHVPIVEHNSHHGFRNNTLGTLYAAQAAILTQVENFVLISTDKAVRPTNMMGVTKRIAELVLQAFSQEPAVCFFDAEQFGVNAGTKVVNRTRFTMVRFGNVLDSSGSVVPKFRQQIRDGGPLTVTHPQVTRYFMTIPEAAQLVIQAGSLGKGGDVFVLDMGEPVKVDKLARQLIRLSGLSVRDADRPDGDIAINYTGLRAGEKLHEELLIGSDIHVTQHPKILRANELVIPWSALEPFLRRIIQLFDAKDYPSLRTRLQAEPAIGYSPNSEISDWLFQPAPTEPAQPSDTGSKIIRIRPD
ncbi:MAG: polysaccharide biosynthesis protein [Porticoccaceae bacterium]